MAYKTEELKEKALEAIKEHDIIFIDELVAYLPCSKSTFYEHKLDKSDELKEAIEKKRTETKQTLRKKWKDSDNATLQMGLYKLLASDPERKALSQSYIDHSTHGKEIKGTSINLGSLDTETLRKLAESSEDS